MAALAAGPSQQSRLQRSSDLPLQNPWRWSLEIHHISGLLELSVKSSKESTEAVSLLKTGNKVVEVG
jgi:hypothetical protein